MPCTTFKSKTNKSCIKDRKKIILRKSTIAGSSSGLYNIDTSFTELLTLSAFIRTNTGVESYDGVNVRDVVTIEFIVPYAPSLGQYLNDVNLNILYDGKKYDVDNIENIDLTYDNIKFSCTERGNQNTIANFP